MCAHPTAIMASKHKNTVIFSSTFSVGQVAQSAVGVYKSGRRPMCENYPTVTGPQLSYLMQSLTWESKVENLNLTFFAAFLQLKLS